MRKEEFCEFRYLREYKAGQMAPDKCKEETTQFNLHACILFSTYRFVNIKHFFHLIVRQPEPVFVKYCLK